MNEQANKQLCVKGGRTEVDKQLSKRWLGCAVTAAFCLTLGAAAQAEGRHRGPPPEAFEACSNQAEGAACSMIGRHGDELQGQCIVPPRGEEQLVCLPEGHGKRRQRGADSSDQIDQTD